MKPVCDCLVLPVNEFLDGAGRVVESRPLSVEAADRDAHDFLALVNAGRVTANRIVCPACRVVYILGAVQPGPPP